jgi:hypothetical protein
MIGRVYKLQCDDGYYYIGSTIQVLKNRLCNHKTKSKLCPDRKIYQHINNDWAKVSIVLVEEVERELLVECEDKHIRASLEDSLCLNSRLAIRTPEQTRAYQKSQYEKHKHRKTAEQKQRAVERSRRYVSRLSDERKQELKEYRHNYYANLTPEQKAERIANQRRRRVEQKLSHQHNGRETCDTAGTHTGQASRL